MTYSVTPSASGTSIKQDGVEVANINASGEWSAKVNGTVQALSNLASIGIGQTWQQFTVGSARLISTVYTNTTGRPIVLKLASSGTSAAHQVVSGGITFVSISNAGGSSQIQSDTIIPAGATYQVTNVVGTLSWYELRA